MTTILIPDHHLVDRRRFIKLGAAAVAGLMVPGLLPAVGQARKRYNRILSLYNTHTGECLDVAYAGKDGYIPEALKDINHILRDRRTNDEIAIDCRLLDYLHALSVALKLTPRHPFHIISGYRSPKTNAFLRRRSKKVAKNSFHIKGMAVDLRVPGISTSTLRRRALRLKRGGVGYYPKSRFLHIDAGNFRYWRS